MKIKKIEQQEDYLGQKTFQVTFEPTWFERTFLRKTTEQTKKYRDDGWVYLWGFGNVYIDQLGNQLKNGNKIGKAIDKWRKRW